MNTQKKSKLLLLGLVIFTLVLWLPTPYVIIEPGHAMSVQPMVQIVGSSVELDGENIQEDGNIQEGKNIQKGEKTHGVDKTHGIENINGVENAQSGKFMLTTVRMSYANVSLFLQSFFKPHADLYLKKNVLQGQSPEEYTEKQMIYMHTSQNNAIQAAYNKADVPYDIKIINNVQIIEATEAGKQVHISADEIGGPSAGLVFALEIYNRLVPHDVTKGYAIAGTGSINPRGEVSPIGGVDYKVVAANKAGADVFFVPVANGPLALEQAARINTSMNIVTVKTIDDALDYLASLPVQ